MIYVSHPYRNNPNKNQKNIKKVIKNLYKMYPQYLFISPLHLFGYFTEVNVNEMLYDDDIMLFDLRVVKLCDEIWIFDYTGNSVGCNNEKLEAMRNDLKVRIFTIEEYKNLLKGDDLY